MWYSNNTATINDIHREIGCINDYLRKMENCVHRYGGIKIDNCEQISEYFIETIKHQEKTKPLLNMLSPREVAKLNLCWMDGRHLPFYLWDASYLMVITQVKNGLDNVSKQLGI